MAQKKGKKALPRPAPPPPPNPLGGLELDARRLQRQQTVEALRQGRTPLTVIELAEGAVALAEQNLAQAQEREPPPPLACKEGCDWCCYMRVGTAVPEVARIVAYLRRTLSPDEFHVVRQRVVQLAELRRELGSRKRADPRLPCPLLAEHRCLAYPVRPLTCRGCNSTDAQACERFVHLGPKEPIPAYEPQHRLSTFVLDGLRAGLAEARLPGDLLELTAALQIALEVPEAVERWLTGEPVFARARLD
jgi:Fe-S-cluster containining protein